MSSPNFSCDIQRRHAKHAPKNASLADLFTEVSLVANFKHLPDSRSMQIAA